MWGTGSITDLVDQMPLVWRNKAKERKAQRGMPLDDAEPGAVLICDKNRNGEWEGRTKLWFERESLRFGDVGSRRRGIARGLR